MLGFRISGIVALTQRVRTCVRFPTSALSIILLLINHSTKRLAACQCAPRRHLRSGARWLRWAGKPAHCRSYLAQWFPCVANYFFASVGDQWGDRAPPRTPVPPSIGTKTNVVATANRSGFSGGALRCIVAQCADRSPTCVLRLRGQAAERTAFGGSVRTLPLAVLSIGFVVVAALAMFLHVGKCRSVLSVPVVGWFGFISAR